MPQSPSHIASFVARLNVNDWFLSAAGQQVYYILALAIIEYPDGSLPPKKAHASRLRIVPSLPVLSSYFRFCTIIHFVKVQSVRVW